MISGSAKYNFNVNPRRGLVWVSILVLALVVFLGSSTVYPASSEHLEGENFANADATATTMQIDNLPGGPTGDPTIDMSHGAVQTNFSLGGTLDNSSPAYSLTASYSSNVKGPIKTWLQDYQAGELGLGWVTEYSRIIRLNNGTGRENDDRFVYYTPGRGVQELRYISRYDDLETYALKDSYEPTIKIQRFVGIDDSYWTVTQPNGVKYYYGGKWGSESPTSYSDDFKQVCAHLQVRNNPAAGRCQPGAVEYGVQWGDWVGASQNPKNQTNIEVAWNLSRIESITGKSTTLSYINDIQDVGRQVEDLKPKAFSRSAYLYRVQQESGAKTVIAYCAMADGSSRTGPNLEDEAQPAHYDLIGTDTAVDFYSEICEPFAHLGSGEFADPHTEAAEPDGHQERLKRVFIGGAVSFMAGNDVPRGQTTLSYDILEGAAYRMDKRVLTGVQQQTYDEVRSTMLPTKPPTLFSYWGQDENDGVSVGETDFSQIYNDQTKAFYGAIKSVTTSTGLTKTYTYNKQELGITRDLEVLSKIKSARTALFSDGYIVLVGADATDTFTVEVVEWTPLGWDITYTHSSDSYAHGTYNAYRLVTMQPTFFAFAAAGSDQIRIVSKSSTSKWHELDPVDISDPDVNFLMQIRSTRDAVFYLSAFVDDERLQNVSIGQYRVDTQENIRGSLLNLPMDDNKRGEPSAAMAVAENLVGLVVTWPDSTVIGQITIYDPKASEWKTSSSATHRAKWCLPNTHEDFKAKRIDCATFDSDYGDLQASIQGNRLIAKLSGLTFHTDIILDGKQPFFDIAVPFDFQTDDKGDISLAPKPYELRNVTPDAEETYPYTVINADSRLPPDFRNFPFLFAPLGDDDDFGSRIVAMDPDIQKAGHLRPGWLKVGKSEYGLNDTWGAKGGGLGSAISEYWVPHPPEIEVHFRPHHYSLYQPTSGFEASRQGDFYGSFLNARRSIMDVTLNNHSVSESKVEQDFDVLAANCTYRSFDGKSTTSDEIQFNPYRKTGALAQYVNGAATDPNISTRVYFNTPDTPPPSIGCVGAISLSENLLTTYNAVGKREYHALYPRITSDGHSVMARSLGNIESLEAALSEDDIRRYIAINDAKAEFAELQASAKGFLILGYVLNGLTMIGDIVTGNPSGLIFNAEFTLAFTVVGQDTQKAFKHAQNTLNAAVHKLTTANPSSNLNGSRFNLYNTAVVYLNPDGTVEFNSDIGDYIDDHDGKEVEVSGIKKYDPESGVVTFQTNVGPYVRMLVNGSLGVANQVFDQEDMTGGEENDYFALGMGRNFITYQKKDKDGKYTCWKNHDHLLTSAPVTEKYDEPCLFGMQGKLLVHRVIDERGIGKIDSIVVDTVTYDDGMQTTKVAYDFEATTASHDRDGVNYNKATISPGGRDGGNGHIEKLMYNGAEADVTVVCEEFNVDTGKYADCQDADALGTVDSRTYLDRLRGMVYEQSVYENFNTEPEAVTQIRYTVQVIKRTGFPDAVRVLPIRTDHTQDDVTTVSSNDYNEYGQKTKTTTLVNKFDHNTGTVIDEGVQTSVVYGWETDTYGVFVSSNRYQDVVQTTRFRLEPNGMSDASLVPFSSLISTPQLADSLNQHLLGSSAKTYAQISIDGMDDKVYLPESSYIYQADSSETDTPAFDQSNPSSKWIAMGETTTRDGATGIPLVTTNVQTGMVSSRLLTPSEPRISYATFGNADAHALQASYTGFETYEDRNQSDNFTLTGGSIVTHGYAGTWSYGSDSDNVSVTVSSYNAPAQVMLLSSWVNPSNGNTCQLGIGEKAVTSQGGDGNTWMYLEMAADAGPSASVSCDSGGYIDEVLIRPVDSSFGSKAHNARYRTITATNNNGVVTRLVRDQRNRLLGSYRNDPDGRLRLSGFPMVGFSRYGGFGFEIEHITSDNFDQGQPNHSATVAFQDDTRSYYVPGSPEGHHIEVSSRFAMRLVAYGGVNISAGDGDQKLSLMTNGDTLVLSQDALSVTSDQIPGSKTARVLTWVVIDQYSAVFLDGKMVISTNQLTPITESGTKPIQFGDGIESNIFVGQDPIMSRAFHDGAGRTIQTQSLHLDEENEPTHIKISQALYDGWGRQSVQTKLTELDQALGNYDSDFVTGFDWFTDTISGDVWLLNEGNIPFTRTNYASSPLLRPSKQSLLPGDEFNIGGTRVERFGYGSTHDASDNTLLGAHDLYQTQNFLPYTDGIMLESTTITDKAGRTVSTKHGHQDHGGFIEWKYQYDYWSGNAFKETTAYTPNYNAAVVPGHDAFKNVSTTWDNMGAVKTAQEPDLSGHAMVISDNSGRPRFTRKSVPSISGDISGVSYLKYDRRGRIIETGVLNDVSHSMSEYQALANNEHFPSPSKACLQTRYLYDADEQTGYTQPYLTGRLYGLISTMNLIVDNPTDRCFEGKDRGNSYIFYQYDQRGRTIGVSEVTDATLRNSAYLYNKVGARLALVYPETERMTDDDQTTGYAGLSEDRKRALLFDSSDQTTVYYPLNVLGQLDAICNSSDCGDTQYTSEYRYDVYGKIIGNKLDNGSMTQTREYDFQERLTKLETKNSDDDVLFTETLSYDPYQSGNIRRVEYTGSALGDGEHRYDYDYDIWGRLVAATRSNGDDLSTLTHKYEYSYDHNGNMLTKRVLGATDADVIEDSIFAYVPGKNQLATVTDSVTEKVREFAHNDYGAVTQFTNADGKAVTYELHPRNDRVHRVSIDDGYEAEYLYDPLGRRIRKNAGSWSPEPGTEYNLRVAGSNLMDGVGQCIGTADGNDGNTTNIELSACSYFDDQKWTYDSSNKEIKGIGDRCLDIGGGDSSSGANVQLYDCHGGDNQKWTYSKSTELVKSEGGHCVGADGNDVKVYDCDNGNVLRMEWLFPPSLPEPGFAHFYQVTGAGDKCLDVQGGSSDDGTNVQLYDCSGEENQLWKHYPDTGEIKGLDGKCLDVQGGGVSSGDNVQLYTCHGGDNQKWSYDTNSGETKGATTGKCLDVQGGSTDNGSNIQIYTCHGGPNQKWIWEMASFDPVEPGVPYKIESNDGKCMEVISDDDASDVRVRDCTDSYGQVWTYDDHSKNIKNGDRCLILATEEFAHTYIFAFNCDPDSNSDLQYINSDLQWSYSIFTGGISPSDYDGKCIKDSGDPDTALTVEDCNKNDHAQQWTFTVAESDLTPAPSIPFNLHIKQGDLCVSAGDQGDNPRLVPCDRDDDNQGWVYNADTKQIMKDNQQCWESFLAEDANVVIMQACDDSIPSQEWSPQIPSGKIYVGYSQDSCVGLGNNDILTEVACSDEIGPDWTWEAHSPPKSGIWYQIKGDDNKCLSTNSETTGILFEDCADDEHQNWAYHYDTKEITASNGHCLDWHEDPDNDNEVTIIIASCSGDDQSSQQWEFNALSGAIKSHGGGHDGECLAADPDHHSGGTPITLEDCDGGDDQTWDWHPVSAIMPVSGHNYSIRSHDGRCLGTTSSVDETRGQMEDCGNDIDQMWTYDSPHIKSVKNDSQCFASASTGNYVGTVVTDCGDFDNDKWIFNPDTYQISQEVDSSLCLDINPDDNSKPQIRTCDPDKSNQRWQFSTPPSVDLTNRRVIQGDACVAAIDGTLLLESCSDGDDAKWTYDYDTKRITGADKCWDRSSNSASSVYVNYVNVNDCNDSDSQKWDPQFPTGTISPSGDGEACIGWDGFAIVGAFVVLHSCNGSDSQQWTWESPKATLKQHDADDGGLEVSHHLPISVPRMSPEHGSAYNDQISALSVADGYTIEVYKHKNYGGQQLTYVGPQSVGAEELGAAGMDDAISSYKLYVTPEDVAPPPEAPTILSVIPHQQEIEVHWENEDETVLGYQYSFDDGDTYTDMQGIDDDGMSYIFTDLEEGTEYTIMIRAVSAQGESEPATIVATTLSLAPETPVATLSQHDDADGGLEIARYAPASVPGIGPEHGSAYNDQISALSVADGYTIEVYEHQNYGGQQLVYVGPKSVGAEELGAAGMDDAISSYKLYVTPEDVATPPETPTVLDVFPYEQEIVVHWENEDETVLGYQYSFDGGDTYTDMQGIDGSAVSYIFTDLEEGTEYTIMIRAVSAQGESEPATIVATTLSLAPETPVATLSQHDDADGGLEIARYAPASVPGIGPEHGSAYNDQISALSVADEYTIEVYEHQNYGGQQLVYVGPKSVGAEELGAAGMDDAISSYKLYVTPEDIATPPETPTVLDVFPYEQEIVVHWENEDETVLGYQYSFDGGDTYTDMQGIDGSAVSYIFTDLEEGTEYTIMIRAVSAQGESEPATIVATTLSSAPETPVATLSQHDDADGGLEIARYAPASVPGIGPEHGSAYNDQISALSVADEYTIEVYEHQNYGGQQLVYVGPKSVGAEELGAAGMDDAISSYKLYVTPEDVATPPETPTVLDVFPYEQEIVVHWENEDETVLGYQYSFDGGDTYIDMQGIDGSAVSYIFTDLEEGTEYTIMIRAVSAQGESEPATIVATTLSLAPEAPETPTVLDVFPYEQEIVVHWENEDETVLGYQYSFDGGDTYTDMQGIDGSAVSYIFTDLEEGTEYTIMIRAVSAQGESEPATIVATTTSSAPEMPNVISVFPFEQEIVVLWENEDETVIGYQYSFDGGDTYTDMQGIDDGGALSYTFTDLEEDTEYTIMIRAVNSQGESEPATIVATTTSSAPEMPEMPNVISVFPFEQEIVVHWENEDETVLGYQYSFDGGATYTDMQGIDGSAVSYAFTDLEEDTEYTIMIRAVSAQGESEPATVVATTTSSAPEMPEE